MASSAVPEVCCCATLRVVESRSRCRYTSTDRPHYVRQTGVAVDAWPCPCPPVLVLRLRTTSDGSENKLNVEAKSDERPRCSIGADCASLSCACQAEHVEMVFAAFAPAPVPEMP